MKKLFFALVCLFALSTQTFADRPVEKSQLPVKVQEFVKKHFPNVEISYAQKDNDWFDRELTVVLANGTKLEFTSKGEWLDVDCERGRVPESIIPAEIKKFISENHKNHYVKEIKKERRHYDVKLNNDLDMEFSLNGKLLRYD